jgi:hypothetical protein
VRILDDLTFCPNGISLLQPMFGGVNMSITYYPILKWKRGEQGALNNLWVDQHRFIPIIELYDENSPQEFLTQLESCYSGPVYLDTINIDDDSRSLIKDFTALAAESEKEVFPLIYPSDISQADNFCGNFSRFAIKLSIPDDFEGESNASILEKVKQKKLDGQIIDIIFDAGEVLERRMANQTFSNYKTTLDILLPDSNWINKVAICLTSFPSHSSIESGDNAEYYRFDYSIFRSLFNQYGDECLAFSDYGVTKFTETELDFSRMRYGPLPKIKYTTSEKYICLKGQRARRPGDPNRTYLDMAREIANSNYFSGRTFSFGDNAIFEKANGIDLHCGNATNWVEYNANHHMALVISQLSNLSET